MEMNIEKKYKVVDSVFFDGEIDYLLFRFTELTDVVDYFIVLELVSENKDIPSIFEINKEKFEPWADKIKHIKSEFPNDKVISEMMDKYELGPKNNLKINHLKLGQIYDLTAHLNSLGLRFDDIVLISNFDEIPILPDLEVLQSYLSFEPVIFLQKDFLWSKNFIKQENHLGSLCFQYSHFITNNTIQFLFTENESRDLTLNFTPIDSGYRFDLFNDSEKSIDKIISKYGHDNFDQVKFIVDDSRNNLVYYNFKTLSNPKSLVKYVGILPKSIDMLDSQEIGRTNPKKHLVVIGIDSFQNIDADGYETVSIVSHTTSITSEPHKEISSNCKIYYIQIPNKKYYDVLIDNNSLENFQKMYFLNEIKKILFSFYPLDIDIFEFYFAGKIKSHSWSEIKDNFIYDLLHN